MRHIIVHCRDRRRLLRRLLGIETQDILGLLDSLDLGEPSTPTLVLPREAGGVIRSRRRVIWELVLIASVRRSVDGRQESVGLEADGGAVTEWRFLQDGGVLAHLLLDGGLRGWMLVWSAHGFEGDTLTLVFWAGERQATESAKKGARAPEVPEGSLLPPWHGVVWGVAKVHLALHPEVRI